MNSKGILKFISIILFINFNVLCHLDCQHAALIEPAYRPGMIHASRQAHHPQGERIFLKEDLSQAALVVQKKRAGSGIVVACRRLEKHRYPWSGASSVDCLQSGRLPPGCRWALEAGRHDVTTNKGPAALAAAVAEAQTQSDIRQPAGEIEYWLVAYQGEPLKIVHFSRWTSHVAARAFFEAPELVEIRPCCWCSCPRFHLSERYRGGRSPHP